MIFVFDRVENIVGKEENAGYHHFHLFPQCLQRAFTQCPEKFHFKTFILTSLKTQDCVVKNESILKTTTMYVFSGDLKKRINKSSLFTTRS